jgi:hypothetical protein
VRLCISSQRSSPQGPAAKPCITLARTGACLHGMKCIFSVSHNWTPSRLRAAAMCPFASHGACVYGSRCVFIHDEAELADRSTAFSVVSLTDELIAPCRRPTDYAAPCGCYTNGPLSVA